MELREKIARQIFAICDNVFAQEVFAEAAVAQILDIPEIRDALNGVRPVGGYWERTGTGKGARKWVPAP